MRHREKIWSWKWAVNSEIKVKSCGEDILLVRLRVDGKIDAYKSFGLEENHFCGITMKGKFNYPEERHTYSKYHSYAHKFTKDEGRCLVFGSQYFFQSTAQYNSQQLDISECLNAKVRMFKCFNILQTILQFFASSTSQLTTVSYKPRWIKPVSSWMSSKEVSQKAT